MAVSMIYGIPQIISFKRYTICDRWVYSYRFTKYMVFPIGVKRLVNRWIKKLLTIKFCISLGRKCYFYQ